MTFSDCINIALSLYGLTPEQAAEFQFAPDLHASVQSCDKIR